MVLKFMKIGMMCVSVAGLSPTSNMSIDLQNQIMLSLCKKSTTTSRTITIEGNLIINSIFVVTGDVTVKGGIFYIEQPNIILTPCPFVVLGDLIVTGNLFYISQSNTTPTPRPLSAPNKR